MLVQNMIKIMSGNFLGGSSFIASGRKKEK